jgi:hypothetical protein
MRFVSDRHPAAASGNVIADFYRQELIKHRQCLEEQRAYYSERAIDEMEAALSRILAHLDQLCTKSDADQVMGKLLRKFDLLTGLSAYSAWSDKPPSLH